MYISKLIYEGNLVHEWRQGNVKVRIFSDKYALKTSVDIERSLEEIKSIALDILNTTQEDNS